MELFDRFEEALSNALSEYEGARNVSTKADATIMLKELLASSNMYVEYKRKKEGLDAFRKNEQTTE